MIIIVVVTVSKPDAVRNDAGGGDAEKVDAGGRAGAGGSDTLVGSVAAEEVEAVVLDEVARLKMDVDSELELEVVLDDAAGTIVGNPFVVENTEEVVAADTAYRL